MELLLLSNSTSRGRGFLEHARAELAGFLSGCDRLLFIPYALAGHDAYTARVRDALAPLGVMTEGLHERADPSAAVREASAIFIGGGNSFRLLRALHRLGLVDPLRARVIGGTRYIGSSAGTNMACPTLRTTNDMPIVEPPSFGALRLVPFQVNPHYIDPDPSSAYMGETREARIVEFLEENDVPVLGLREGSWLRVGGGVARLGGDRGGRLFRRGHDPLELSPGADVSFLLTVTGRFDVPLR